MLKYLAITMTCLSIASAAHAQDEGSVALGKSLAEANCSQCHNIAPGGAFKLYPPSFTAVATYMDPDIIRMRIMTPNHVLMPQFQNYMSPSNLDSLVTYIQSLE